MQSNQYFAAMESGQGFLDALNTRVRKWDEWLDSSGVGQRWARVMKVYHGIRPDQGESVINSGRLLKVGKQGELTYLSSNHFRNLVQHQYVLVTSNRPAWKARAANSDHKSQVQAQLGDGVLDYYLRDKQLETNVKSPVESTLLFGEGHTFQVWNPALGEPYVTDPQTGRVVKEGDVDTWNPLPPDVIRDPAARKLALSPWRIVRFHPNKYELAERFPDQAEKILSSRPDVYESSRLRSDPTEQEECDHIPAFWLVHDRTDTLPKGRMTLFVNDAILLDGPLAYKRLPLYTMMPAPIPNMPVGYTPAFDALPIQEAINILGSSILSNQKAFAVQNVWTKPSGNLSVTQLAGGLNLLESEEKPEALQLCQTPAEVFNFRSELIGEMETIMGINAVVRGQPEANLKSGNALALVASQAVQFMSGLQGEYNLLMEALGAGTLRLLRQYAKSKRVANIIGIKNQSYQKEWTGSDLGAVDGVIVEQAPAISKTTAGNVQIADNLMQHGMLKNPQEYLQVVRTGNLDPLVEDDSAQLLLIRRENEALIAGKTVRVIVSEQHAAHAMGHLATLNSPEAKEDPGLADRVLAHVQEHLNAWRSASPEILMLTGQQPPPPMMPPGMPMQGGPGALGTPAPQGQGAPPMQNPQAPAPGMPAMPSLPQGAPEQAQAAYEQMNPQLPPAAAGVA